MDFELPDDSATAAFGARLAACLRAGDIVLLDGDLGAGKTALARAVIRALVGAPKLDVPSPTFALVQPYDGASGPILHADLYRLAAEREIDELGFFDNAAAIILVEWPERAPSLQSLATVFVHLGIPRSGGRLLNLRFTDGRTL